MSKIKKSKKKAKIKAISLRQFNLDKVFDDLSKQEGLKLKFS